ncbi:MAG: type III pantothenate kinase [Oxalobacter sp.]
MLLIDVGNTSIKWARPKHGAVPRYDETPWQHVGIVRHRDMASLERIWQELHGVKPVRHVLISNVAGKEISDILTSFLKTLPASPDIRYFASQASHAGITNTYRNCSQLGCDRFASMIGAHALFPDKPLVVATAGTATTIDSITPEGVFQGGMILPGLGLMAHSLALNTEQLPEIDRMEEDITPFANHTRAAILAGCLNAQSGAIERTVEAFRKRYDNVNCLVSGGAAKYIVPCLSVPCHIVSNLVLIGLYVSAMSAGQA